MENSSEQSIESCYTVVYDFDNQNRTWEVAGPGGWSELHICHDEADQSFRILAWTHDTQEVLVNVNLDANCEYKEKSNNFHSFKDEKGVRRGFGFHKSEKNLQSAQQFLDIVVKTLTELRRNAQMENPTNNGRNFSIIATVPTISKEARQNPPERQPDGSLLIRAPCDAKMKSSSTTIENPDKVVHEAHVSIDPKTGEYNIQNVHKMPAGFEKVMRQKFGVPPASLPGVQIAGYNAKIPLHLVQMKSRLKKLGGLEVTGIFRLAPDAGESNRIKEVMNNGGQWLEMEYDVNVLANLLKIWFRDLPKPLLNCVDPSVIERNQTVETVCVAIKQFPEPQQSLLIWLWDFCVEIAEHEAKNKMGIQNLGIVIGPNLFNTLSFENPMKAMDFSGKVVTFFQKGVEWRKQVQRES